MSCLLHRSLWLSMRSRLYYNKTKLTTLTLKMFDDPRQNFCREIFAAPSYYYFTVVQRTNLWLEKKEYSRNCLLPHPRLVQSLDAVCLKHLSILYLLPHTKLALSFGKLDRSIDAGRVWNWESVVKLVWIVALLFCDSSCTPSDWRYTPTGTICAGYTSGATWAACYATGACMTNIRKTEFAGASYMHCFFERSEALNRS